MNRAQKRKPDGNPTSDKISDLPRNVIETILECLPIRDAVRTSILSRKWRYNWITLPQLVFDDQFLRETVGTKNSNVYDKCISIVNKVLLLHDGPVLKFVLNIPRSNTSTCSIDIDQWILFLSRNGIKELSLEYSDWPRHKLPSYIFSCQGLTHLKLSCCEFTPPHVFKGFQKIKSLELYYVIFPTNMFETIISSSPLFERLKLQFCSGIGHLDIRSPSLKYLDVNDNLKSICFKHSPNLTEVSIRAYISEENSELSKISTLIKLFGAMPKIEKLLLDYNYLKVLAAGGVPDRLPTPANHLKSLTLTSIDFNIFDMMSLTLCLIRSSPNLQELEICARTSRYQSDAVEAPLNFLEAQDCTEYTLEQLRIVKFLFITVSRPELELIKNLLSCSPLLETMFIKYERTFINSHVLIDTKAVSRMTRESMRNQLSNAKAELLMTRELTQFRRASPKAEIIFLDW